jgi:hypothetical protein
MRRRGSWLVALAALALATACSGLPTSGEVHTQPGTADTSDQVPYFVPPGPVRGADREEIVRGFLLATQANPPSTSVARSFLSERARTTWQPVGTTVYDNPTLETTSAGVVAHLTSAHRLDQRGSWVSSASTSSIDLGFDLTLEDGEWRIQNPPHTLPVPASYFTNLYVPYLLYFFDRTGTVLVPSRVYLPAGEQIASSLVRGLLAGPAHAQSDSTVSAFGDDVGLDLSVVLSKDGVAEVPLSNQVQKLPAADLYRSVIQLAATLRQLPGLVKIRVTVDGIAVPLINGQTDVDVDVAGEFDPVTAAGRDLVALTAGHVVSSDGDTSKAVGGPLGRDGFALGSVAENLERGVIAAVAQNGRRAYEAPSTGSDKATRVRTVLDGATDLLPPVYDRFGNLWLLDATKAGAVVHLVANGKDKVVDVRGVSGQDISAFTLTRDGTKLVAGLVGGPTPTLAVSALVRSASGQVLRADRAERLSVQGADLARIVDLGQDSATTVSVLTQPSTGSSRIFSVELDGSSGSNEPDPADPLPGTAIQLLTSPDGRLPLRVVMKDGSLLTFGNGEWDRSAKAILAASYPQ